MAPGSVSLPAQDLQDILDELADALIVLGADRSVVYLNEAARRLGLGEGSDSSHEPDRSGDGSLRLTTHAGQRLGRRGDPLHRLLHDEEFDDLRLLAGGLRRSGEEVALSLSGRLLRADDGSVRYRLLLVREVGPERDGLFRRAFSGNPVPLAVVRCRDSMVLEANGSFVDLLGRSRRTVVGRALGELGFSGEPAAPEPTDGDMREGRLELASPEGVRRLLRCRTTGIGEPEEPCMLLSLDDTDCGSPHEEQLSEATERLLQSASLFSSSVVEQLERLRQGKTGAVEQRPYDLTRRERDVLSLLASGRKNGSIALELSLSERTVRNYLSRVYRKIGVAGRAEAVVWALERGLGASVPRGGRLRELGVEN